MPFHCLSFLSDLNAIFSLFCCFIVNKCHLNKKNNKKGGSLKFSLHFNRRQIRLDPFIIHHHSSLSSMLIAEKWTSCWMADFASSDTQTSCFQFSIHKFSQHVFNSKQLVIKMSWKTSGMIECLRKRDFFGCRIRPDPKLTVTKRAQKGESGMDQINTTTVLV